MQFTYNVGKPPAITASYLTDMNKFVAVHPVITQMKPVGENKFIVYETLRVWFFSFSFTYPAVITANAEKNTISMQSTVMKMARISMVFTISESDSGSLVKEEITVKSRLPIHSILRRIFKKQHALLFANIARV